MFMSEETTSVNVSLCLCQWRQHQSMLVWCAGLCLICLCNYCNRISGGPVTRVLLIVQQEVTYWSQPLETVSFKLRFSLFTATT